MHLLRGPGAGSAWLNGLVVCALATSGLACATGGTADAADPGSTAESADRTPVPPPLIEPAADGSMRMVFGARSPDGSFEALARRFNWSRKYGPTDIDYEIEAESFTVYMPPDYDPTVADHGLLVWISPTPRGSIPTVWQPVLDRQALIWVAANDAGNDRPVQWHRFGLALDALYNMRSLFAIDDRRVYVAGFSGGGRAASHLAPTHADLVQGAIYICGVSYFRTISELRRPAFHYEPAFARPGPEIYALACKRSRYVLMTGERDFNRDETRSIWRNGYERDPFEHVTYIEVPEMEHELPDPEWLEQAIEVLDAPLADAEER